MYDANKDCKWVKTIRHFIPSNPKDTGQFQILCSNPRYNKILHKFERKCHFDTKYGPETRSHDRKYTVKKILIPKYDAVFDFKKINF